MPRRATQEMLLKMLQKKIKGLKYENYGIEKTPHDERINKGIAYISTTDHKTMTQLLKLHYHVSVLFLFYFLLDLCGIQAENLSNGLYL